MVKTLTAKDINTHTDYPIPSDSFFDPRSKVRMYIIFPSRVPSLRFAFHAVAWS